MRQLPRALEEWVLSRDSGNCQRCGSAAGLVVHHIWPGVLFPESFTVARNLVTLCDWCHDWVHSPYNTGRHWLKLGEHWQSAKHVKRWAQRPHYVNRLLERIDLLENCLRCYGRGISRKADRPPHGTRKQRLKCRFCAGLGKRIKLEYLTTAQFPEKMFSPPLAQPLTVGLDSTCE